ncbi:MAG: hypothetical protein K6G72_13970 [Lachnospiraceae bacterium]|nr:hypothetical protein [Lachnospiraceae bacterium]
MSHSIISEHYKNVLTERVKNAGCPCDNFDDVLKNVRVLAKEQTKYGDEKAFWLDLSTKKMIAKAIDPDCRIEIPFNEIHRNKDTLMVTAYFYWGDSEHYAGRGFARRSLTDIVSRENADAITASKIETEFEALVMGAAITRAYTDAGIGLELYADGFEELFSLVEEQEAEDILDRKKEQFDKAVPDVPSHEEKKKRTRKAAEKPAPVTTSEPETPTPTPVVEQKFEQEELPFGKEPVETVSEEVEAPTTSETPTATLAEEPSAISLEEAYETVADTGVFEGQKLSAIYRSRPINLIWLVNAEAKCKDACLAIIDQDPALKAKLEGNRK